MKTKSNLNSQMSKLQVKSKKIKFILTSTALFTIHLSLFPRVTLAICPVCTVAVGAGLGISRWLGIDDAVTSVWIGGLILSMSFWTIDWLQKKGKNLNDFLQFAIFAGMYALVLVPLQYGKYIGRDLNTYLGIDKILLGTFLGSLAFLLGKWLDKKMREKKGKQLFSYQKVVFPVLSLVIISLVLHFIVS